MPELPDVAGFHHELQRSALNQSIASTAVPDARVLVDVTPQSLGRHLKRRKLTTTHRHGKFLFARTDEDGWLVFHFGMTGQLSAFADRTPEHTCVVLVFQTGRKLAYRSQRKRGQVSYTKTVDAVVQEHELGPDALDDELTSTKFIERLAGRRGAIKPALMDQSLMAGVGNVYADEILFQAGIHPQAAAANMARDDKQVLHRVMRRVLRTAARHDARLDRLPDGYLLPIRDQGECPRCGGRITKESVSGRTTYFCTTCQPRP